MLYSFHWLKQFITVTLLYHTHWLFDISRTLKLNSHKTVYYDTYVLSNTKTMLSFSHVKVIFFALQLQLILGFFDQTVEYMIKRFKLSIVR